MPGRAASVVGQPSSGGGWVKWAISGGWISREKTGRVFETDPWDGVWGRRPTLLCAHFWCFFATWPVSFVEIAGIPLLVAVLIRMHRNWRYVLSMLLQPLFVAAASFWVVQLVSRWWAIGGQGQWLEQAGQVRWLWALGLMWPVIQHRRSLAVTLGIGCLIGNATQLSQFLHVQLGWPVPTWDRAADRYSGWWPPVICGTVLVAALGLHLPGLLLPGPVCRRLLAGLACVVTTAGILASGTRGAWVAGAGLIVVCAIAAVVVGRNRGQQGNGSTAVTHPNPSLGEGLWKRRAVAITVVVLLLFAGIVGWQFTGGSIARRFELARQEIATALAKGEYRTDTGARIGMAIWAWELFRDHPWGGVGAGVYKPAVQQMLSSRGVDASGQSVHDHAHNGILHIAATTGLAGLIPALAVIVIGLRNAWVLGTDRWRRFGAYEWAPAGALVGLLLVSAFDPVHLNAQTGALLATLLGLCPSFVPHSSPPGMRSPGGAG